MITRRIVAAAGAAAALGVLATTAPAWAAPSTQVVQGEVLRLVSIADWDAASSLLPGQPVRWDVTVSAEAPDPGTVAVGISATGDAALLVDAALCAQPWGESGCAGGATPLKTDWALPRDGTESPLLDMSDEDIAHLRLTVTLGDGGGSTQMRVHARGAGESAVIGPEGGLATTGGTGVPAGVLAAGLGLVAVGTALSASRRRRRRSDRRGRS